MKLVPFARYALPSLGLAAALALGVPALAQDATPKAAPPATQETQAQKIQRLVGLLGDDSYETREKAQKELEAIGAPALPALREATHSKDPEVQSRASEAISVITKGSAHSPSDEQGPVDRPSTPGQAAPSPNQGMPGLPDMNQILKQQHELFKQLQRQLPDGFGKLFQNLFRNMNPGQHDTQNGRSRVHVWTWSNTTRPRAPRSGLERELGLRLGPPSEALRAQLGIRPGEGQVVDHVDPAGYAARAGLQRYDVVVAVRDHAVTAPSDLRPLLTQGGKVQVYRHAKLQTLDLEAANSQTRTRTPEPPAQKKNPKERSF